jgi:transcriptional regulator GlxA family with amidase domain
MDRAPFNDILADSAPEEPAEAAASVSRGLSRQALSRASGFMQQKLGERITLPEVAAAACVSRAHFARMFRLSTGVTPMAYLMQLRVARAKQLIADRRLPICDIAVALGFCDQSHFSRVFRRMTGLPPRSYARQLECADAHAGARTIEPRCPH